MVKKMINNTTDQDECQTNKFRFSKSDEKLSRSSRWKCPLGVQLVLLLVLVSGHFKIADSLRFTSIQMPALVQRGTNFWLSCQYELSGAFASSAKREGQPGESDTTGTANPPGEQLYSVKWYKNNEEFYRLIFALGGANQHQSFGQSEQPPFGGAGQQQCFTQPGVNVLMSSSNATHVRLLNASLDTDGSYACEISTQNLSTIRFEKEIKVYVLPSSKLNLIGLKGLYSLGDRVELNCLSDFSRPAAALSWFINGRRLITSGPNALLKLEPQLTRPKATEPKLSRSSLTLKFKLTNEILLAATSSSQTWDLFDRTATSNNSDSSTQTTSTRRNQSKLLLLKSYNNGQAGEQQSDSSRRLSASSQTGLRLVELLKLECRYKLTEVSDVTFSELRVASGEQPAPTSGVDGARPAAAGAEFVSSLVERGRRRRRRALGQSASQRRRPSLASSAAIVDGQQQASGLHNQNHNHRNRPGLLVKSLANQVHQSSCPARRDELAALLGGATRAATSTACRWGLLALQREDPVILEADDEEQDTDDGEDTDGEPNEANQHGGRLKLAVGSTIAINCSTLSAVTHPQTVALVGDSSRRLRLRPTGSSDNDGQGERNNADSRQDELGVERQQSVIYCDDIEARRRLLVSGKHQDELHWNEWPLANQRHKSSLLAKHKRHHVAYVSFEAPTTRMNSTSANNNNNNNNGRRQQQQLARTTNADHDDKLSLSNLNGASADSSNLHQLEGALKSLDQLHNNAIELDATTTTTNNNNMQQSASLAPPLLEWFINNQEAPKSSASYWPEIPLTTTAGRQQVAPSSSSYANQKEPDEEPTQLPSIDYREYFANFDARTTDQHLMLRLTLEKKHFMTPDSLLKLRCTSTQAEVLAIDSLEVSLYAIPPGANLSADQLNQQHARDQERHDSSSNWRQRSATSQIKSKYLHRQQSSKSAGQHNLNSDGIEQQRRLLARPSSATGASSTKLMLSTWTLHLVACCWLVLGFKINSSIEPGSSRTWLVSCQT